MSGILTVKFLSVEVILIRCLVTEARRWRRFSRPILVDLISADSGWRLLITTISSLSFLIDMTIGCYTDLLLCFMAFSTSIWSDIDSTQPLALSNSSLQSTLMHPSEKRSWMSEM